MGVKVRIGVDIGETVGEGVAMGTNNAVGEVFSVSVGVGDQLWL